MEKTDHCMLCGSHWFLPTFKDDVLMQECGNCGGHMSDMVCLKVNARIARLKGENRALKKVIERLKKERA